MRIFALIIVSLFLVSCESMLWRGGGFKDLYINDFNLMRGEIELLMSQDYINYESSVVGGHSSKHEFIRGEVYSTGRVGLMSLLSDSDSKIVLFKVGEKADYLRGLYLSGGHPRTMLVNSYSFQRCDEYKGRCKRVVLEGEPVSDKYSVFKVALRESEGLIYIDYQASPDSQLVRVSRKYQLKDGGDEYDLLVVD